MAYYRLYFLSRLGHIQQRVEDFEAADDGTAVAKAAGESCRPMELWCAGRRVEQWPCSEPADNSA